jgi:hypothetical protein
MYRVTWGREILDKLAEVYDRLDEHRREQLMVALDSLDAGLIDNPLTLGESRDSPYVRVAIQSPLMVEFRINETQQVVRVSGVSYIRRSS